MVEFQTPVFRRHGGFPLGGGTEDRAIVLGVTVHDFLE